MSDSSASTSDKEDAGSLEGSKPDAAELTSAIEIWKQIISVQMHFNDIEMTIRNLYVTVLLATVAAIGWVLEHQLKLQVAALGVHYAALLLGAGLVASYLFYFIDRYWYHQLLRGAVQQGKLLDEHYGRHIPALGLTSKISGASPILGFRKRKWGRGLALLQIISPPAHGEGIDDLHSTAKIELFYKTPMRILWLLILLSLMFGGVTVWNLSVWQMLTSVVREFMGS